MTFHPDGTITDGNAIVVASVSDSNRTILEPREADYLDSREARATMRLMSQRHGVCG